MNKLLLLFLLLPTISFSETWVCSYIHNGKIETHKYKRVSDKEFIDIDLKQSLQVFNEDSNQITLAYSHGDLGMTVKISEKKGKRRFNSTWTSFESADQTAKKNAVEMILELIKPYCKNFE